MNINTLHGVGPKLTTALQNINVFTVNDLLEYYPYRYSFIKFLSLDDVILENGHIEAFIVTEPRVIYIKKNFNKMIFKVSISDKIVDVFIFNRAFMRNLLTVNKMVILFGKYDSLKNSFVAADIKFNLVNNTIEPIYHLTTDISNSLLIKLIDQSLLLDYEIKDLIPSEINDKYNFIKKNDSIKYIHKPDTANHLKQAKLKLIYEELFVFMFKINYLKENQKQSLGIARKIESSVISNFYKLLPYELTTDQKKTCEEIKNDMLSKSRMNRLVLGDVGSGKTSVAAFAIYLNFLSQHQTAFMAPTEILAVQHYASLIKLFKGLNINIELLTGHMMKKEKSNVFERLSSGEIDILIGTHALIGNNVNFYNLGLVITDEQHRFGVLQRKILENKGYKSDVLYLSATPIPRTYALTIYGDTDVSIIKTKPFGRKEIITKVYKEKDVKKVLLKIWDEIKLGHQVFVVSPLIDNDESDLNSIKKLKEKFELAFKNKVQIGIINGKMKQGVKDSLMNDFKQNKIQILISTTVIEVGIDIPNASVMTIFNAERFGLATLHQLRGRVGRGDIQSYCFLISNSDTKRLKVMEESNDGFYITEKDFEQRREGDLFGIKQSGDMVFKIADIKRDYLILLQAQKDSENFIKTSQYKNNLEYEKIINNLNFIN